MSKTKKRKQLTNKRKRFLIANAFLALFLFLGIGYSALSTNLNILGSITIKERLKPTLYNVLKKATQDGYAREYIGEHHDSFTKEPTHKIYQWYGNNTDQALEINNKNNVLFADHCWQIMRTTDTGGTKMIYNGEAEDGKCQNNRNNHVGYSKRITKSLSESYFYGTSYTYDSTNNVFSLNGTITTGTIQPGQYTCNSSSSTGTCETLYLVDTLEEGTTYYVLPLNSNSHYSCFGSLQFNQKDDSASYVGYMYNSVYPSHSLEFNYEHMLDWSYINTRNYYYAESYDYNTVTNEYTLNNPYSVTSTSDYSSLVGKYTLLSTSSTFSTTNIYYISTVEGDTMYLVKISDGNDLNYYNNSYTYGESYTDNGNGTFTINNPTTINLTDYYSHYNNMRSKYICKNAVDNTCSELWHADSANVYFSTIAYIDSNNTYRFSKEFTYDESSNKYTLSSDNITFWDLYDGNLETLLKTHHYTCWSNNSECSQVSFIFNFSLGKPYYINLTEGKSSEDAVDDMLYGNVNSINSVMKTGIDAWYKRYLFEYSNYIEDTIYCNDRKQTNLNKNGWNPNGGDLKTVMVFKDTWASYDDLDLKCENITDKFSVSNSEAQLIYPIGLPTQQEILLYNNRNIYKTGNNYSVISPYTFGYKQASVAYVSEDGYLSSGESVTKEVGVRPVISLKPGIEYTTGNGSMDNPYVVKLD